MARPKLKIDEDRVAELAGQGASDREIGDILGCDHKTVANRFSPILKKQRAERRLGIRRAQTEAALAGVPALLIWLGKQELGQVDKQVVTRRDAESPRRLTIPGADERRESGDAG